MTDADAAGGPDHADRLDARIDELERQRDHLAERLTVLRSQRDALSDDGATEDEGRITVSKAAQEEAATAAERVHDLVRDLAGSDCATPHGVATDDVLRAAIAADLEEDEAADAIDTLRRRGTVYSPRSGYVRPTLRHSP